MVRSSLRTLPPKNTGSKWASHVIGLSVSGNDRFSFRCSTSLKVLKVHLESLRKLASFKRERIFLSLKQSCQTIIRYAYVIAQISLLLITKSLTLSRGIDLRYRCWNTDRAIVRRSPGTWTPRRRISLRRSWWSDQVASIRPKSRSSAYYARHPSGWRLHGRIGLQRTTVSIIILVVKSKVNERNVLFIRLFNGRSEPVRFTKLSEEFDGGTDDQCHLYLVEWYGRHWTDGCSWLWSTAPLSLVRLCQDRWRAKRGILDRFRNVSSDSRWSICMPIISALLRSSQGVGRQWGQACKMHGLRSRRRTSCATSENGKVDESVKWIRGTWRVVSTISIRLKTDRIGQIESEFPGKRERRNLPSRSRNCSNLKATKLDRRMKSD